MINDRLRYKGFPVPFYSAPLHHRAAYFLGTTFCTGHLPAAGTWGALVAWVLHTFLFPHAFTLEYGWLGLIILAGVTGVGIWTGDVVERLSGIKDDSRVNIDEVAGYFLAVLFVPAGWQYTVPAFFLARFFDILKPPPAYQLQHIHGGFGIMIDDLIASVYACFCMHIGIFLIQFVR